MKCLDQFYFGGHAGFGPVVDRLWFRPNLEAGFGDNRRLIALNAEFVYWLTPAGWNWSVYFGGGPVGLGRASGFFGEVKVGAIDSPGFKFGVGYTFP